MGENLTITKKGLLLVAVPLLFQLVFIGFLIKMQRDSIEAQRQAVRTKDVIARTEAVFRTLVQAHSSIRGLIVTGDPVFSRSYEQFMQRLPQELAGLRRLVRDSRDQRVGLERIIASIEPFQAWLTTTNRLVAVGQREEAVARVRNLSGMKLMDSLRGEVDRFLGEAGQIDQLKREILLESWRRQNWLLAGGLVLTLLIAFGMVVGFGSSISSRLALLTANARRLEEGKELAPPLTGRDEISQLDRVFHDMADALAARNQENELFIYSVSHDLRSPLVNLQGFSEELNLACQDLRDTLTRGDLPSETRQQALAILDQDIPQSLHFIQTAVSRLAAIIDALLRLSRAGRVVYQWQQVDVQGVVNRVVESLRGTITERGAEITLKRLPPAWGDPTAVEQIFANLINNAVSYLDPARPGQIEIGSIDDAVISPEPDGLRTYYVKDNGLGIDKLYQPKLFLAFQRFHARIAQGEGIGLALARQAVERHGGKIWAESEPGNGSTFFVALPARPLDGQPDGR